MKGVEDPADHCYGHSELPDWEADDIVVLFTLGSEEAGLESHDLEQGLIFRSGTCYQKGRTFGWSSDVAAETDRFPAIHRALGLWSHDFVLRSICRSGDRRCVVTSEIG